MNTIDQLTEKPIDQWSEDDKTNVLSMLGMATDAHQTNLSIIVNLKQRLIDAEQQIGKLEEQLNARQD